MSPFCTQKAMYTALSLHMGQDAYVFWIVGLVVVCFTLVQAARAGGPMIRLPQPTGAHLATILAWLIIAISVLFAISRRHR